MLCHIFAAIIALIVTIIGWIYDFTLMPTTYSGGDLAQERALRKYRKFKVKKPYPTFREFCFPKSYSIQRQQAFAGEYMAPGSNHQSMLVFHKIGAGKTCLSIQIMRKWVGHKLGRPLIVLPASSIPSFRNELRSPCAGNDYMSEEERAWLKEAQPGSVKYKEILAMSDKRIDNDYQIYSYNKFSTDGDKIKAPIIVIDEVQNVANTDGVYFRALLKWVEKNKKSPVVVMSGTPIFDHPRELDAIARLMRIDIPISDHITPAMIPKLFSSKVTFFKGAPDYTYPETHIKVRKCVMSHHQFRWYKSTVEAEMNAQGNIKEHDIDNDFYIKSRQRSNIVPPRGLTGNAGIRAMTPAMIRNLPTYSCKYAALMKKLRRNELSFIYTSFTGLGGIATLTKVLQYHGYVNFATHGPGKRRYAIFSGEETGREKDLLRATFNSPANDDASQIQIVIGSPAIKEGVSLLRVRQCHILELYWNFSRLEQIWGRVNRYCSHKSLPKDQRSVMIYLYAAVAPGPIKYISGTRTPDPMYSIDLFMLHTAEVKKQISEPYIDALIDVAVDKLLN